MKQKEEYCSWCFSQSRWIFWSNVVGYIIIFIILCILLWWEGKDIGCPNSVKSPSSECGFGKGAAYSQGLIEQGDSCSTLITKIEKSSNVLQFTIYWRRNLLVGFFATVLVWLFVMLRVPNVLEFLLTWLLIFLVAYFFANFYNFHHYMPPYENIRTATNLVKQRCL